MTHLQYNPEVLRELQILFSNTNSTLTTVKLEDGNYGIINSDGETVLRGNLAELNFLEAVHAEFGSVLDALKTLSEANGLLISACEDAQILIGTYERILQVVKNTDAEARPEEMVKHSEATGEQ